MLMPDRQGTRFITEQDLCTFSLLPKLLLVFTHTQFCPITAHGSLSPVSTRAGVHEAPAAKEDQSESTQSDSDDCIVHGRAAGRKVGVYPPHTERHQTPVQGGNTKTCR